MNARVVAALEKATGALMGWKQEEYVDTGEALDLIQELRSLLSDVSAQTLTDRELATVLAALRHWQRHEDRGPELNVATDGGRFSPLDGSELNGLCERLNTEASPEKA